MSVTINEDKVPPGLKAYDFHGLDLTIRDGHGVGECPFCTKAGKFSVDCETSQWKCWSCGGGLESGGGNALSFIRLLYDKSSELTTDKFYEEVANDRRLLYVDTPKRWGVVQSYIEENWLVAGYGTDGKVNQLYRRVHVKDSDGVYVWRLLPTPGIWGEGKVHALHFDVETFDPNRSKPGVVICEGLWDGVALSEVTTNDELGSADIIAVPGCNVWRDEWTAYCKGRHVTILFDSDHPVQKGVRTYIAGYDGVVRIAKRLSGVASSVNWLRWGKDGYCQQKPNGWDIRDALSGMPLEPPLEEEDRRSVLYGLIRQIEPASQDWFSKNSNGDAKAGYHSGTATRDTSIEVRPCHTWKDCETSWDGKQGGALYWRPTMSDSLAVLFAICASTQQSGNQNFLQFLGQAGSAKTTLVEGLLVSRHCWRLEHLTGFHSGWKSEGEEVGACSLLEKINGKTLVTPEADVIVSSPRFQEIMSQQRRIFDGKSAANYKNTKKDLIYEGLRTPWILAGTPALIDSDQSRLGDRFQRIIMDPPTEEDKQEILMSALDSEFSSIVQTSNGTAGSIVDDKTRKAQALTGGYVDWLRANVEEKLIQVTANIPRSAKIVLKDLGDFCADMRARPIETKKRREFSDTDDTKELPTRLVRQNGRLAAHLAVVFNQTNIDHNILRIVRKVALDTSYGHTLKIANWLCSNNPKADGHTHQECGGIPEVTLAAWCNMKDQTMENYLYFLKKIGVLDNFKPPKLGVVWRLTDRVYNLYTGLMGELTNE